MIDSVPVLAFVRDNMDQIILGAVGIVIPVILGAVLEAARAAAERRGGR